MAAAAARRGDGDLVADILVLAVAANFAAFLFDVPKPNIYTAHEIGPLLSLGAALAGRVLGGPLSARPPEAGCPGLAAAGLRGLRLAAVLACYAVLLGIAAAHPQAAPRNVGLSAWLARHNLTQRPRALLGGGQCHGGHRRRVKMLSVSAAGWHGQLAPQKWQTDVRLPEPGPGQRQLRHPLAGRGRAPAPGAGRLRQARRQLPVRAVHDLGLTTEPAAGSSPGRPPAR